MLILEQMRLTLQRKKRTNLETQRDIAANIEQRVEQFNAKGKYVFRVINPFSS
jgi:hypothetical protein